MIVRTWRKDSGERLPPLGGSEQHVHVLTLLVMSVGRAVGLTTVCPSHGERPSVRS